MTTELLPVGNACNLRCRYCFCDDRSRPTCDRMPEMMELAAKQGGSHIALHGGEPLLMPFEQLKEYFELCRKHGCKPGMQTNGSLISERHIALFAEYGAGIGVSIDGPGELNDLRISRCGDPEVTRAMTRRTMLNIVRMRRAGVAVDVIITMHRLNGVPGKIERLLRFTDWLVSLGVRHANFHWLQPVDPSADYVLSSDEEIEAFMTLARYYDTRTDRRWVPFEDIKSALRGDGQRLCLWNGCDPLSTPAVYGIRADLSVGNCERLGTWLKADRPGYERYQCLAQADMAHGGCADCRWFGICLGGCPGECIDNDWRNRTIHCRTIQALMRHYEDQLLAAGITPVSVPERRRALLDTLMASWRNGISCASGHGDSHGDHTDATRQRSGGHGDVPHGDSHGDAHGDHTDASGG